MTRQLIVIAASIFFLASNLSYAATYNNISGTYSGTISITDLDSISPPNTCPDKGNFTGSLTITLVGDDNGNITSGSGQFINDATGIADSFTVLSGFNDNTTFSIFIDVSGGDSGTLSGSFSSTTITNIGGFVDGDPCDTTINSGNLTRTDSGTTVASESTPSSTVTDAVLFNTLIQTTVFGISSHVSSALSTFISSFSPRFGDNSFKLDGSLGVNAGDGVTIPYGIWGNYSYTDFENDLSSTAIDGSSHSFLGGIDFRVWDTTIIGVALGFDNSDIDTGFNGGNQNTDTITIAPYFGTILDDTLSIDFSIGYSNASYDQFRTAGTTRITSTPTADRWFASFNMNAIKFIDNWILSGRVGSVYAKSVIKGYTESNGVVVSDSRSKVGSVSIAGEAAYSFKEWEPFLNIAYQYDYQLQEVVAASGPQPSNDKDDILLATGVRYFEKSGISGNLEYSKRLGRDNFDEDRVSLTLRIDY
jgi:hypothetical protein